MPLRPEPGVVSCVLSLPVNVIIQWSSVDPKQPSILTEGVRAHTTFQSQLYASRLVPRSIFLLPPQPAAAPESRTQRNIMISLTCPSSF